MAICETCGKDSRDAFQVSMGGGTAHIFDTCECAIKALAPKCAQCGGRIAGESAHPNATVFCSAKCAASAAESTSLEKVCAVEDAASPGELLTAAADFPVGTFGG
jgi:hypothetical protein